MTVPAWQKLAVSGASAAVIAAAVAGTFEGVRHKAYSDVTGTPTICMGHTKGVYPGMTATPAQCKAWLTAEMAATERYVRSIVGDQPDTRIAALTDACYNLGQAGCRKILNRIAAGNIRGGCNSLMLYDKAAGQVLPGLVKRRRAERALCLEGVE
jgi:lysozyme